ncbi:hypothetical protein [Methylobacterium nigriterrae]|uniref:hypothetical protein n=1 Tax=Methylobacterium nigriterrae TaxID=3127512 RepID=UPI00301404C7
MPIGARRGLGAALLLGLALGAPPSWAEDPAPPARAWTDPPVRGSAASPAAQPLPPKAAEAASEKPAERAEAAKPPAARQARRSSRQKAAAVSASRAVRRHAERRIAVAALHPTRPPRARARSSASSRTSPYATFVVRERYATPYGAPYPVGQIGAPVYGYTLADDRLRRIEAAQRAGYIVVRARSVQFPDGRSLRTYRPLEEGDDDE